MWLKRSTSDDPKYDRPDDRPELSSPCVEEEVHPVLIGLDTVPLQRYTGPRDRAGKKFDGRLW